MMMVMIFFLFLFLGFVTFLLCFTSFRRFFICSRCIFVSVHISGGISQLNSTAEKTDWSKDRNNLCYVSIKIMRDGAGLYPSQSKFNLSMCSIA